MELQFPCLTINDPKELLEKNLKPFSNLKIINFYFKKLDDVPVHIQILTINNCQLQSIKNLFNLDKLIYCDVKNNMISDLSGIELHLELQYLDFSNNNVIIVPKDIKQQLQLKTIISENNYIVNQEPIISHTNFNVEWIQTQFIPEQKDFRKCLTPGTSDEKVNELMNNENAKRERSQYLENMIKTLAPLIKGNELIAKDLLGITHFGLVDCFDIDTLCLDHCPNINFTELPKKIKHLSITNSGLYRIDGLENMKQLESIDLTHNKLISCKLLLQLPNLSQVNVQGNKIQDLEHITKLPKFQWNFISPQRLAYLTDFQKYLGNESSEQDALNLQKEMSEEQKKSLEIVYDAKQIDRLKGQVANGSLEISSDANITSFGFVDHWELTSLKIVDCPNLSLERAPKKLTSLTITECGLKSTKGIENAKLLTHLSLSKNSLTDLEDLEKLTALEELDLSFNQLYQIDQVSALVKLKSLNVKRNNLIVIKPIETLGQLKSLKIDDNMIQDLEYVKKLVNFDWEMISQQKEPKESDYRNYLEKIGSKDSVQEMIDKTAAKAVISSQIVHDSLMIRKYKGQVKDKSLTILNDPALLSTEFSDELALEYLIVGGSTNLTLERVPKKLKHFAINNCNLKSTRGLAPAQLLISLDLSNNLLNDLTELDVLISLQKLNISFNALENIDNVGKLTQLVSLNVKRNHLMIIKPIETLKLLEELDITDNTLQDLQYVKQLPKLKWEVIVKQNRIELVEVKKQTEDGKIKADEKSSDMELSEEQKKSLEIVYDAKQIDRLKGQVANGSLEISSDANITSFGFVDHWELTSLKIVDCPNLSLERAPKKLTSLTITECGLKSTKGIENAKLLTHLSLSKNSLTDLEDLEKLTALEELDLSFNQLYQIDQVSALVKLKSLNVKRNNLIVIKPIETLGQLKSLKIDDNMIQDLEYVKKLVNFDWEMISQQKEPKESDYRNYLEKIGSKDSVQEMIDKTAAKAVISSQIVHDSLMIRKYKGQVKDKSLTILNDPALLSTEFSDELALEYLIVGGLTNLTLERVPKKLKHFAINNCNLKSTRGLAPAQLLISLDLSNNLLNDLTELDVLISLQKLNISFNALENIDNVGKLTQLVSLNVKRNHLMIIKPIETLKLLEELDITDNTLQDLQYVKQLPKLKWEVIVKQNRIELVEVKKQTEDGKIKADEKSSDMELSEEQKKSLEIVYDAKQIDRLKDHVKDGSLEISSDANITSFGFVDHWELTSLKIVDCPNLSLERAPKKLTSLTITECGLKSTKGIENAKLLTHLSLSKNSLTDLEDLEKLTALEELDLSFNQLYQIDQVSALVKLKSLNVKRNNLIVIKPVNTLQDLQFIDISENQIQDLQYVKALQKLSWDMIAQQNEPVLIDYQKYLGEGTTEQEAKIFAASIINDQKTSKQILYDTKMIRKFKDKIQNGSLEISFDSNVTSFGFVDQFKLNSLKITNCKNLTLERAPKLLISITINECGLQSTEGIQNATELTSLNLQNNLISDLKDLDKLTLLQHLDISNNQLFDITNVGKLMKLETLNLSNNNLIICKPLEALKLLASLQIDGNMILDLSYVKKLEKFNWDMITEQNEPNNQDYHNYLGSNSSETYNLQIQQLIENLQHDANISSQIVHDMQQINKYKAQVKDQKLIIQNDATLLSIEFSEHLDVHELVVMNCYNLILERCPKNITKLTINSCNLSDLSGIEIMTQLINLNLSMNQLKQIEKLAPLEGLTCLDLGQNNIDDISVLSNFKKLNTLDISQNLVSDISSIAVLTQIKILDISYNLISKLDDISALINIERLNVSKNNIASIDCLGNMVDLIYLNISMNQVTSLAVCKKLPKLQDLRIKSNFIQNFESLAHLEHVNKFWVQQQLSEEQYMKKTNFNQQDVKNLLARTQTAHSQNQLSLIKKYKSDDPSQNILKIDNDSALDSLQFTDILNINQFEANNCQTISFEESSYPRHLLKLKLNNCRFKGSDGSNQLITNIYLLQQLIELDLSHNQISVIQELENLINLTHLNLEFNNVCWISPLSQLPLQYLNLNNNRIIFAAPLKQLTNIALLNNNLIVDLNIQGQSTPNTANYKQVLGPNSTELQAAELNQFIHYTSQFALKYKSGSENGKLTITNDNDLSDLYFTKVLGVETIKINNCQNVKLKRKCKYLVEVDGFANPDVQIQISLNIKSLTINNCGITHLQGVENMKELIEINVNNNRIVSIIQLLELKVEIVNLEHNFITDLNKLTQMKNYSTEWIQEQKIATDEDYLRYIEETEQKITVQEFKAQIDEDKIKTEELIQQFGTYEKEMIAKYKDTVQNHQLIIENDETINNLNFADDLDINSINVNNCINVTFVKVPTKITSLTINNCKLTNVVGIENIKQLQKIELFNNGFNNIQQIFGLENVTSLTINNSKLTNVIGIENMKQLTYLNLKENRILLIEPIQSLPSLKQLIIDNNFIHDLESITTHNNYSLEWITFQNTPTDSDIQNYLKDTNSTSNLNDFKTLLALKKIKTDELIKQKNDSELLSKYKSQIENNFLKITNDQNVQDFKIISQLNIQQLVLNNCVNIQFRHTPTKITSLIINNTTITNIAGIENMKQLQHADLRDNCIISCEPLKHLVNLQQLFIDNNCIQDLEHITALPNYTIDWIYYQRTPSDSDIQNYLQLSNIGVDFNAHFALKLQKTKELIKNGPESYDEKMVRKYQNAVSCNKLTIENDPELKDFKFVEKFNINWLDINNCPNVRFWRTPNHLNQFNIRYCCLKNINGVQRMNKLTILRLWDNDIIDVSCIQNMHTHITHLVVDRNKIIDFSYLKQFIDKKSIYNGYASQQQPTQQEIEESKIMW
ncbi:Leucine_rich repeats-containing protein [Hexamita inflata]|uniref:Leucine_rich repeats-containing protein n=1 Tax=Hexamita inflata TaxID=28002 RepID=A0ABP1KJ87_9EUKA